MGLHIWLFGLTLLTALLVGLWSSTLYESLPGLSDSPDFGIPHGSPAKEWVRYLMKRTIVFVASPIAVVALVALAGWGHAIYSWNTKDRESDQATITLPSSST